jgi:uncharacterized protein (UPF0332 family)
MIPKDDKKLNKEYQRCRKSFVKVDKESYIHYKNEAYSDLQSAEKDESEKWAITKAYQSLFLMCNALLVRNLGFYSKDHSCVIIALLKNNILTEETINKINDMLNEKKKLLSEFKPKKNFFEEISNIRITRNRYLYLPETERKLKSSHKAIIEEVKEIINILSEAEE